MNPSNNFESDHEKIINDIDQNYSKRFIALDPSGYFLIKVNHDSKELIVEHFNNDIDEKGRALDPETGEILQCNGKATRSPVQIFKGRTAKEIGIKLTEENLPLLLTKLDHALYLGRELQKAEYCLLHGTNYVQD